MTMRGSRRATRVCIRVKPYQRRRVRLPDGLGGVGQLDPAVDGDRVVDGGQHRAGRAGHDAEQAGAEALVVVDDVEVVAPGGQRPARPAG